MTFNLCACAQLGICLQLHALFHLTLNPIGCLDLISFPITLRILKTISENKLYRAQGALQVSKGSIVTTSIDVNQVVSIHKDHCHYLIQSCAKTSIAQEGAVYEFFERLGKAC